LLAVAAAAVVAFGGTGHAIYNGSPVDNNQFPWVVQVRWRNGVWCSGSLIRSDAVLTAAHCVQHGAGGARVITLPFVHRRSTPVRAMAVPTAATSQWGGYMGDASCTARDDIAILWMKWSLQITPVPLALVDRPPEGSPVTPMGFGANNRPADNDVALCGHGWPRQPASTFPKSLLAATATVTSSTACSTADPPGDRFAFAPETQLCVNGGEASINHGDSGGPLVWNGSLAGVASTFLTGPPYLDGFTSVAAETSWLQAQLTAQPVAVQHRS
jgi:trypsin